MIVIDYNGKTVFEIVVDHTPRVKLNYMPRPQDDNSWVSSNHARAKMANGEESIPVRKRTLRVTLEIDIVEMPPDRYGEIYGGAKERGIKVAEYAADAFESANGNKIASCIQRAALHPRKAALDPLAFTDSLEHVKVEEVRIIQTSWQHE